MKPAPPLLADPKPEEIHAFAEACGVDPATIERQIRALQRNSRPPGERAGDRDNAPIAPTLRREIQRQRKGQRTMNNHYKDPMQEAADNASGFEGQHLKHDLKRGSVLLDSVPVESGFRACLFMSTAQHGWIQFDENNKFVAKDIRRYVDVAPTEDEFEEPHKPNTSVLGISMPNDGPGAILTYAGSSRGVRRAFDGQLWRPYNRLRKAFPVVTFGFKAGKDYYGNSVPLFSIVDWKPCTDFAGILGEEALAPSIEARRPTAGIAYRKPVEPIDDDILVNGYAGVDPGDLIR